MKEAILGVHRIVHAEFAEAAQDRTRKLRVGWRISLTPSQAEVFIASHDLENLENSLDFHRDPEIKRVLEALGCQDPEKASELLDNIAG